MRVTVKVPGILQSLVGGLRTIAAEGETIEEVLDDLESRYPRFSAGLIDEKGEVHPFVNLYLNDEDIRFLKQLKTPVTDGDIITIVPSVAGGCSQKREETAQAVKIDREIRLKGEVCPYTFVKSLLALEEMEVGQVLRVIVDYLPAVQNVPRSMQNEGQQILEVAQVNDTDWAITIKKSA